MTHWSNKHDKYEAQDWINKPSLFAETAVTYFPAGGKVLELGAGQGQDSRFFAQNGFSVVSTDLEDAALEKNQAKLPAELKSKITIQKLDLRDELPFADGTFDVVYAHLSLQYFTRDSTQRLINEILRVLKPEGILAFLVNSTSDPEYGTGEQIEPDYYVIHGIAKRFFSVDSTRTLTQHMNIFLLDNHGETYKDNAAGVHNLIRFIGAKKLEQFKQCIPFCGAIVERTHNGQTELLMQTRWKGVADTVYSGTLEFPAGKLDQPFENVFDTLAREIKEESGLTLKSIKDP
jgi:SAM-dependent methyltransferase